MKFLSLPALLLSLFCKGSQSAPPPVKQAPLPSPDQSAWQEIEGWIEADANPPQIANTQTRRLREAYADSHMCWILVPNEKAELTFLPKDGERAV